MVKILYVILTCEKFYERVQRQAQSWLIYRGEESEWIPLEKHLAGIEDTYENVPIKYSDFIKRYKYFNDFDWVFFCDDDTFVFPKKLHHLLRYFNKDEPIMIGRTGVYEGWQVCSGGAGFAVSQNLILKIQDYLKNNTYEHLPNSDTSFGMWSKLAEPDLKIIDRIEQFQTQHLRHEDNALIDIDSCITFHYVDERDYKILNKYLKYAV